MSVRAVRGALPAALGLALAVVAPASAASPPRVATVQLGGPRTAFRPDRAFGQALDGHEHGDTARIYRPGVLRVMRTSGLGAIAYRLRTELGGEVWHWTDHGRWSDPARREGYWTGDPVPRGSPPAATYGYRLPRRGNTIDQAEATGWSRIDDGDPRTFWKSDPYLDRPYVARDRPAWVVVDLGASRGVDALRIAWGTPWATRFSVARWVGAQPAVRDGAPGENRRFSAAGAASGRWVAFPRGRAVAGSGGTRTLRLAARPLRTRWLRVLVTASSHTASAGSRDPRDALGVAMRELWAGTAAGGGLRDLVRHGSGARRQSVVWVSSTDPWHTARDRDPNTEQPGFGVVRSAGLGAGRPIMTPVSAVYGVPADAGNLVRYLRALGWPIGSVEVGEEPDGQDLLPEDDAALWAQAARAVRAADPGVPLVGPGLSGALPDWRTWPDARGDRSWTRRWLTALAAGGPRPTVFSFEWYPFDDPCRTGAAQLAGAPGLLAGLLRRVRQAGARMPVAVTEYGWSAFAAEPEVDRAGALFDVGTALETLRLGGAGATAYLYGVEPDVLLRETAACPAWGNLLLWRSADSRTVRQPTAARWAMSLLTRHWAQPGDGRHLLLATHLRGAPVGVRAWAVRRPDGRRALLLLDPRAAPVTVRVPAALRDGSRWTLGPAEYRWHPAGARGFAAPDRAPTPGIVRRGLVRVPPLGLVAVVGPRPRARAAAVRAVTVTARPGPSGPSFTAADALGAGLDGHERGDTARIYRPAVVRRMAASGLGAISYRLRTELGIEAWHWTPRGTWSDPTRHQGYWTPRPGPGPLPAATYGYALPRRGTTHDQAEDTGYSRLDDGSSSTFWKSDPYLDRPYVGRPHPQWVLLDFGRHVPIDAVRIAWGRPFARRVHVQWFRGQDAVFLAGHPPGRWVDFPSGARRSNGGVQTLRVAGRPRRTRFVRLLLEAPSRTAPAGARDPRDRLGFAIRELGAGVLGPGGRLRDLVRHRPDQRQTATFASSTDPWHRAQDRDPHYEQPSFTTVLRSGLTRGRPLMVPVPVLYGTPGAAAAEVAWLHAHGVPLARIELGEEPDGQLASPEDYGALYAQVAQAIRRVDRATPLGGPGYQTAIPDWTFWPDARGRRSWTARFLSELRRDGARRELGFFSFEWYPWDDVCRPTAPQLRRSAEILDAVLRRQAAAGLPARLPRVISEYGYSAFAGEPEVTRAGGLLDADVAARLLTRHPGAAAYFYGYEPDALATDPAERCRSWGALTTLLRPAGGGPPRPTARFWAMRLLTGPWAGGSGAMASVPVAIRPADPAVRAYGLRDRAGGLRVLVLNLDPARAVSVSPGAPGAVRAWVMDRRTYAWHAAGPRGAAAPDRAPLTTTVAPGGAVRVGAYGLAVLRAGP